MMVLHTKHGDDLLMMKNIKYYFNENLSYYNKDCNYGDGWNLIDFNCIVD